MNQPLVSIIIPSYNRAHCIAEAVDSVLRQTYPHREIIIVDDGSTDGTAQVLDQFRSTCTLLRSSTRTGPSAARNHGIAAATGEFIAFLDSDDLWLPKKLEVQMRFLTNNPDILVCQTEEIWIRNGRRVNPMKKHKKYSGWIFEQCLPRCIVSPSSVILHRSVFDNVGVFDETMPACEDYDLWLRVALRYHIHLIPRHLIIKRGGHADQQSRTVPHLDRWRIYALGKLLNTAWLTPHQRAAALRELTKKCRIYANGCMKHGRPEEAAAYSKLPHQYAQPHLPEPSHEPCNIP